MFIETNKATTTFNVYRKTNKAPTTSIETNNAATTPIETNKATTTFIETNKVATKPLGNFFLFLELKMNFGKTAAFLG